ncbi:ATP-binding protein [Shimia thalassica]|uniref:ATP-binding protein n=1 Tax=Shimia thalassica TaxID=1715693 RepID=UPI0026E3FACC|nr:ATP-binding protein [Shimia thalassica]MDO6485118.1 ATP-binding protein [Shimia thalassica]
MTFRWLKHYMPRSLYGRAALILILPVITLQLVVSVAFIQRHFEGVTRQMSNAAAREINLIVETVNLADDTTERASDLVFLSDVLNAGISYQDDSAIEDRRRWYDFSGIVIDRIFTTRIPGYRGIDLPDNDFVNVFVDSDLGLLKVQFDRRRVSASNPHQLLVSMVFFGGLMTLIAYFYLRNQLRPITRLSTAAEAFGKGRNIPYSPNGAIEVRAAGNAFLDMRSRIERQIEQRTMMLSGVSHDLRTPLTRLKLGLSLIEEEEAELLLQDVDEMERLLDVFLSFARDAKEGDPEEVDPFALVERIVQDSARSGHDVTLVSCEGSGVASFRVVGVRRAIENIIGNAVRYGSKAEVSVVMTDKYLRIRVEDDGPGIPEDAREEAQKPFTRLDPARNQNKGTGVGLGLAIAADVARAHGGVLRLGTSETLGGLRADIVIGR